MSQGNIAWELQKGQKILTGSAARSSAAINDGVDEAVDITVTGATLGDYVVAVSYSVDLELITLTAYVDTANSVKAQFVNCTGAAITLDAGTVRVIVMERV